MGTVSLIFAFLAFSYVASFPPQPDPANTGLYTRSHKQITSNAIKRAAVEFIRWKNLTDTDKMSGSEVYKNYFGTGLYIFVILTFYKFRLFNSIH